MAQWFRCSLSVAGPFVRRADGFVPFEEMRVTQCCSRSDPLELRFGIVSELTTPAFGLLVGPPNSHFVIAAGKTVLFLT